MRYVIIFLKAVAYFILLILFLAQILTIAKTPDLFEAAWRIALLLIVGIFFAVRWQKRNRKNAQDEAKLMDIS